MKRGLVLGVFALILVMIFSSGVYADWVFREDSGQGSSYTNAPPYPPSCSCDNSYYVINCNGAAVPSSNQNLAFRCRDVYSIDYPDESPVVYFYKLYKPVFENGALCAGFSIPNVIYPGEPFTAIINMTNRGPKWNSSFNYKLGSVNDDKTWNISRVPFTSEANVDYNQNYSFVINAIAPTTLGSYAFSWRMVQETTGWFGSACIQNILVSNSLINGICSTTTHESCTQGNYNNAPEDNSTHYRWTCVGIGSGSITVQCSFDKSATSPEPETPECSDSDGGINYFSAGEVTIEGTVSGGDSCSADGKILTEAYCENGEKRTIDYSCGCFDGACKLGGELVCGAVNTLNLGGFSDSEKDSVDAKINSKVNSGINLILPETPVKSRAQNINNQSDGPYYCGLDLLWHQVHPTLLNLNCMTGNLNRHATCDNVTDIGDLNKDNVINNADRNFYKCIENYECQSNSCVDGFCISISSELKAQRGILTNIWCVITNLPSYLSDDKIRYNQCVSSNPFG